LRRQGRSLSFLGTVILCLLSGLLLPLIFPPLGLWPLAWIALVPWLAALRAGTGLGAFVGSWLAGSVFFGGLLLWLQLFGISVWLLVALLLGGVLMVWGLCMRGVNRLRPGARVLGAAVLWTGFEWVRGLGPFGFTWGWLGYSQSPAIPLLPIARYVGVLGLSFIIVLVNVSLAEVLAALLRRTPSGAALGRAVLGGAVAAMLLGGAGLRMRGQAPSGSTIRAAVIQGNEHGPLTADQVNSPPTAAEQQRTLDIYQALTQEAAARRPVLVVWPESVLASPPEIDPKVAGRLSGIARGNSTWLLAGGPYVDETGRLANSAYLYAPSGNLLSRYDKVQLVPFGEYVPARKHLPFIGRYHVRAQDFVAGTSHRVLQAGTIGIGPMICFESTFPQIGWELAGKGAQVLVVITNDSWFGHTAAAAQHEQMAVLRAVETDRWVLRAASTGISAIIAPDGQVVRKAGLYQRAELSAEIALVSRRAPSVRWGPLFAWVMMGLSVVYVVAPLFARGKAKSRPSPTRRLARAAAKARK
jgi:apolipoprotein N-acyltransferase